MNLLVIGIVFDRLETFLSLMQECSPNRRAFLLIRKIKLVLYTVLTIILSTQRDILGFLLREKSRISQIHHPFHLGH